VCVPGGSTGPRHANPGGGGGGVQPPRTRARWGGGAVGRGGTRFDGACNSSPRESCPAVILCQLLGRETPIESGRNAHRLPGMDGPACRLNTRLELLCAGHTQILEDLSSALQDLTQLCVRSRLIRSRKPIPGTQVPGTVNSPLVSSTRWEVCSFDMVLTLSVSNS